VAESERGEVGGDRSGEVAPTKGWRQRKALLVAMVSVLGVALAFGALTLRKSNKPKQTAQQKEAELQKSVKKTVDKALKDAANVPARSRLIFQNIYPSVVFIRTDEAPDNSRRSSDDSANTDPPTDPPIDPPGDPFGTEAPSIDVPGTDAGSDGARRRPKNGDLVGIGTGVVVNADGSILTANHVVATAKTIYVTYADGTEAIGEIVSQTPENDIAVLKTDKLPDTLVPAVLGGGVEIGDEVYAIGHPLGFVDSFSAGVVSGLNRTVPINEDLTLEGLIQSDAAVNPGNSGGPLVNRNAQVVGIVTALANPVEQNAFAGIGFAVPIGAAAGGAGPGNNGNGGPPQ
jgi:S1-C subfamily serine protease